MDNASGVARDSRSGERDPRIVGEAGAIDLFLAVTGEENGLLGSRYFAARPTVPRASIVANINTDMFLPLFPMKTLMVLGLDESDLGEDIKAAATQAGVAVQATRNRSATGSCGSDQYSFIKLGIPALAMKVGYEPNSPEAAIAAKWTAERYHAPSDDLNPAIDMSAAGAYVAVVRDLAVRIANRQTSRSGTARASSSASRWPPACAI
jgi:Zn-dependent M28 family amino/carboxypeptidase